MKFLILILLFSCSTAQKKEEIVNVEMSTDISANVEIDKTQNTSYGPSIETAPKIKTKPRSAVISLTLYTSMYQSLAFLDLIKKLEKNSINISMISSQGFGSVLAALYAKEKSTSYLEWKLFDLLKRLKGKKIYSKDWSQTINSFISAEFKGLKVNQLKILLLIPEFNGSSLVMNKSEKVSSVLKRAISLKEKSSFMTHPRLYHNDFTKMGADISLMLGFLPQFINFKNLDGYEWGVYTRYLGQVLKSENEVEILRTSKKVELDSLQPLSDINELYSVDLDLYIQTIIERHKQWQEENTNSTIN